MSGRSTAIPPHPASFRDPAGFVFEEDGILLRAVHPDAAADVEHFFNSGLYDDLVAVGLFVRHEPQPAADRLPKGWLAFRPARLPVIGYACEWSHGQLRAAALATLEIERLASRHGMTLKDASSFNIQFAGSRPVFIDLLSFTRSSSERRWIPYRQFCEHFLAPLAMRRYLKGSEVLGAASLAGIPIELASRCLPLRSWFNVGALLHLHLHACSAGAAEHSTASRQQARGTRQPSAAFRSQLIDSLERAVKSLEIATTTSIWSQYRGNNTYSTESAQVKRSFVEEAIKRAESRRVLDLGANDGHYTHVVASLGVPCTAVESDPVCCEAIHATSATSPHADLVNTLRVDLANPTPAHGWAHAERASFVERLQCDMTLSLALIHHLSIACHVPFTHISSLLARLGPHAVVEYIPLDDPMVMQLLAARSGVTDAYLSTLTEDAFRAAFDEHFECVARSEPLSGGRILHHFVRRP